MRATVRQVTPRSAFRLSCALSWLAALLPALCLSTLALAAIQRIYQALAQVRPFTITVFGQEIARLDLLEILHLSPATQAIAGLVENQAVTFLLLAFLLLVVGALVLFATGLLLAAGYNLLAAAGWGLEVELGEEELHSTKDTRLI